MSLRYLKLITIFCCFYTVTDAQTGQMVARGHRATPQTVEKPSTLYYIPQFAGRWQEVKRLDPNKKQVAFMDTSLLHFNDDGTVETRKTTDDKMDLRMIEKASIDDENTLMTADQDYTALSVTKDAIILKDQDDSVHYFKKVKMFAYELADGYGPSKTTATTTKTTVGKISLANFMGNWTVYKREAKPGFITPSSIVLKYLNLTKKVDCQTATGTATIYQGEVSQEVPCTATIDGKNIKITTATVTYDLPVKVADGKELDFGTSEMMYYLKQL
ncbi:MAG TPA: hypothetical protein VK559_07805 [Ferruginibacter sp.]|nr:hypothetical protein [Ferruginibacter sp.]